MRARNYTIESASSEEAGRLYDEYKNYLDRHVERTGNKVVVFALKPAKVKKKETDESRS